MATEQWLQEQGAKGDIRPGWHCAGGGIWRGKNMEFRNFIPLT